MDSTRFDDLLRSLALGLSRRATLAAALSTLFATGSLALVADDTEAKKGHKKKKKKCKKSQKKCGKKCIPKTSCCSSADCGGGGATCQGGACLCPTGQQDCDGACIPADDCCPACTGGRVCVAETCECPAGQQECAGECIPDDQCCDADCPGDTVCHVDDCACPADQPNACPGDICFQFGECCGDSDCPGLPICADGACLCPGEDDITCREACCDGSTDEICNFQRGTCQGGGCVANNFCQGPDFFVCENNIEQACVCASTADATPQTVCVDFHSAFEPASCTPCSSSTECGAGAVCIPGNRQGAIFCGCNNNFCIPLCDGGTPRSAARDDRGPVVIDITALKSGQRKHRRR